MTRMRNKLLIAMQTATLGATGLLQFFSPTVLAQVNQNDTTVEELVVTGSRIKRSEYQSGGQVIQIDQQLIEATGALTIADVLRGSPLNAFGSFSERSGSSAQSNATINLRGLEDTRTLVMIDGRRMVGSPNLGASTTNINMIPMAAVERVEVLADGASAVYGSDAVAGVINIHLHENFDGLKFNLRQGNRANDDGSDFSASMLAGITTEQGNLTFAIEKSHRDAIYDSARGYTKASAKDVDGDGVIDAYIDTVGYSIYGSSIAIYDPDTGYDRIRAATGCTTSNNFLGPVDADIDWGAPSDLNENTYCMYGFANTSTNKAELDKTNIYLNYNRNLNEDTEFYARSILSRVESFGRFAPAAATWDNMPADYKDVPFDIPALQTAGLIGNNYELTGYYRWTNVGPRDNVITDTQLDTTFGLRGKLTGDISYEVYLQKSRYDTKEFGYYYLSYPGLEYVLNKNIDPFSAEGSLAMSAVTTQDNLSDMDKIYGQLQFGLGDWFGSGDVLALVGAERISLNYINKYDRSSEGGFVGGSSGNSAAGDRDINAAFGEAVIPLVNKVELNAAIRYDSYSDFGSATSPSLSATWAVTDTVKLRSRVGKGFRAPSLDQVYGATAFSAEPASDQFTCNKNGIAPEDCSTTQIDTYFYSNKDLDAEKSTSFSIGGNWAIFSDLSVDLSYWKVNIKDVIVQPQTQDVFYAEIAGYQFVPTTNTYIDRSKTKPIVHSSYVNNGELSASGLDLQINAGLDTGIGRFTSNLFMTHTLTYEQPGYFSGRLQDTAGFNLQPEIRMQLTLGWQLAQHSVDLVVDYIGPSSQQDFIAFDDSATAFLDTSDKDLKSWTTMNLSYSFDADRWGKWKIGATNITNEDPVFDRNGQYEQTHYDLYDNTGRVMYLEYSIKM
ncbi:MAG: TonB-dependent receptor [Pseudomonadota bacterium]